MDMIAFLKSKSPRAVGYPGFRPKAADFSWINRREGKPESGDMLPRMAMKAVAGETMALPGAKTKWWAWALVVFGFADSLVQDLSHGPAGHEWQMRWLLVIVRMLMLTVFGWAKALPEYSLNCIPAPSMMPSALIPE